MFPILLTTTDERQPDAVVAWDPLAGNPIATFSGEVAYQGSLVKFGEGALCAAAKKPLIQMWNFQHAASTYKRILTKGLVSAITVSPDDEYIFVAFESGIYVYQTSSGCLVSILDGAHSAKIRELKLSSGHRQTQQMNNHPTVLISVDSSGFLACWPLSSLIGHTHQLLTGTFLVHDSDDDNTAATHHPGSVVGGFSNPDKKSPSWYSLQTAHGVLRCDFMQDAVLLAGSDGLKALSLTDGTLLSTSLSDIAGGLHSLCVLPNEGRVFCGGLDGCLYTTYAHLTKVHLTAEKRIHRCFVNSTMNSARKTVCELALAPVDNSLLFVAARGGLIEVLRPDALLTCLQRFSILNASLSSLDSLKSPDQTPQLTGICVVPRPNWLSATGSSDPTSITTTADLDDDYTDQRSTGSNRTGLEQFKRHFGWRLSDRVHIRLAEPMFRRTATGRSAEVQNAFMDDSCAASSVGFDSEKCFAFINVENDEGDEGVAASAKSKKANNVEETEAQRARKEIEKLTAINRQLLKQLIDNELRRD